MKEREFDERAVARDDAIKALGPACERLYGTCLRFWIYPTTNGVPLEGLGQALEILMCVDQRAKCVKLLFTHTWGFLVTVGRDAAHPLGSSALI